MSRLLVAQITNETGAIQGINPSKERDFRVDKRKKGKYAVKTKTNLRKRWVTSVSSVLEVWPVVREKTSFRHQNSAENRPGGSFFSRNLHWKWRRKRVGRLHHHRPTTTGMPGKNENVNFKKMFQFLLLQCFTCLTITASYL